MGRARGPSVAAGCFGAAGTAAVVGGSEAGEAVSGGGGAGEVSASAGGAISFLRALATPLPLCSPSAARRCGCALSGGLVGAVAGGALSSGESGRGGNREITSGRVKIGATVPWLAKSSSKLPAKGLGVWADPCPSPATENRTANVRVRMSISLVTRDLLGQRGEQRTVPARF